MSENPQATSRETPPPKETYRDVLASLLKGDWPKIVIALFVIELALLFFFSSAPVSSSLEQTVGSSYNQTVQTTYSLGFLPRAVYLFQNNFQIASIELVPAFGWFFFFFVSYNTGIILAVEAVTQNIPGPIAMLALLFIPDTWIELPAYSIATVQSLFLIFGIGRYILRRVLGINPNPGIDWRKLRFEFMRTIIVWILIAIELIVAALFESAAISVSNLAGLGVLWLLFAVMITTILVWRSRFLKSYVAKHPILPSGFQPDMSRMQPPPPTRPHLYDTVPIFPIKGAEQKMTSRPNFCTRCGARVQSTDAVFCDQCGNKLA
jgi:Stage II sporulation protein M